MRILIATDLSRGSDEAIRQGTAFASKEDALGVVITTPGGEREAEPSLPTKARADVFDQVARVADRDVEIFVDEGVDYAGIVARAEAWHADLVVVGSYGRSGLPRALGHVAERTVRYAHCDVLVARASTGKGPVLAATDLSQPSLGALVAGAQQASRRGVSLEVVHAIGFLDVEATYVIDQATPGISLATSDDEAFRLPLVQAVRRLGIDAECKILRNPAAVAIVKEADAIGAELVVVGTHGSTGLARLMLGSVAEKVIRAAGCSVLLVRPRARA
jgi:nucleotide-binding universal stress UspA family protein